MLITFLLFSLTVNADDAKLEDNKEHLHPLWSVLIMEGFLLSNAYWASESPNEYGLLAGLLFPINGCNYSYCADLVAAESIALYNLSVNPDKTSKREIFENNLIAWHLFVGFGILSEYLIDEPNTKLNLVPVGDGMGLQFKYNF